MMQPLCLLSIHPGLDAAASEKQADPRTPCGVSVQIPFLIHASFNYGGRGTVLTASTAKQVDRRIECRSQDEIATRYFGQTVSG